MSKVFKNGSGQLITKNLFLENAYADKSQAIYTLKDEDHTLNGKDYPSLYLLYMNLEDQTEYEFANTYLYSWEHWKILQNCTWFIPYITRWREELSLKILRRHLLAIEEKAASGDSLSRKYIIERGWEKAPELKKRAKKQDQSQPNTIPSDVLKSDFERIFPTSTEKVN